MSKLKKEHIDKIESFFDITMPHKFTEVTFEISSNRQSTINTGHEYFTMDVETPLLIVHYHIEGRDGTFAPQPLHDVRYVILGFQFANHDGGIIEHEPYILDADLGIVALVMDNQWDFTGTVYCHNYLQFYNQRSLDAGLLQMQWTKSWLDMELPQLAQLEISRFTELIMQIHTMAGIAVAELQGQLDVIVQQIIDAEVVTRAEFFESLAEVNTNAQNLEDKISINTQAIEEIRGGALPTTEEVVEARPDIHGTEHDSLGDRLDTIESNGFNIKDRTIPQRRNLQIRNLGEHVNLVKVGEVTTMMPRKKGSLIISDVGIGEDSPYPMRLVKVGEVTINE